MKYNPETLLRVKPISVETAASGAATPSVVDTIGYDECLLILVAGTFSGDESRTIQITESTSSDGSSPSNITSAAFAAITTTNDETTYVARVNLRPPGGTRKRYLTCAITASGTGASTYTLVAVLLRPHDTALQASGAGGNTWVFSV